MRIVTDTNVLISATFWDGASNWIINQVETKKVVLCLSFQILAEYEKVIDELKDKIRNKNLDFLLPYSKLLQISTIVFPKIKLNVVKDDPDDNMILECALECEADCIISYDNHLLKLKCFRGIKIIKPEVFIAMILDN